MVRTGSEKAEELGLLEGWVVLEMSGSLRCFHIKYKKSAERRGKVWAVNHKILRGREFDADWVRETEEQALVEFVARLRERVDALRITAAQHDAEAARLRKKANRALEAARDASAKLRDLKRKKHA